jgi:GntR family transcriptional regulator
MLSINFHSREPLADQLIRGIRECVANGTLQPGAELPPVRQLADDLGINLNTVARAYRTLQNSGLVHTARGRGTHVTASLEAPVASRRVAKTRLATSLRAALSDAKLADLDRADVQRVIEAQVENLWPSAETEDA